MAAGYSESSSWQGHSRDYRRCQTQIGARKKITSAARKQSLGKDCGCCVHMEEAVSESHRVTWYVGGLCIALA